MEFSYTELWDDILLELKKNLSDISFNTWFSDIEILNIYNSTIILGCNNSLILETINLRYIDSLTSIIFNITKHSYKVKCILKESFKNEYSKNLTKTIVLKNNNDILNTSLNSNLNSKYTFETFVVGNSNRFAHAASLAVAESPSKAYNPLFIYGGVGLGKTHLMHAIGHLINENNSKLKVVYLTSEKFINELISSIKDDKNIEFRDKYRTVDVLLIDDVQFIAGKERTQEEFFHTFNALHESNKQIILSSDRPPKEIKTLEERLRSRFEWGLIADIQPPDYETRIAILRKKSDVDNLNVPNEVLIYIATKIKSNIRELEGALLRVVAYTNLTNTPISLELAKEALKDLISVNNSKIITIEYIQETISNYFDLTIDIIKSQRRTQNIAFPRQIAMYLCRKLTDSSLPKIGEKFGGRDHTTVIHAYEKILNKIESDPEFNNLINELSNKITNNK
ncbi:chromosomal replication initiator protein DnaA [Candidatus Arthromitus sp. SFB-rat-Yit]|uniref:chromosomal replication initiator protein DnaA n=1 Tax=Candidatus Arthromitus sp. SFB-rat-Yit TaxID=1041504 RepID=UPI000227A5B5|nr:chromosomal replication initiator protein DnaA [Candidatus Arthromitus sp. SFB-rat-Yit]BAK80563.1 chromosomal replication initiator protein DnaA [Candidatus Arthromitus sp. SFB-rat-Yit]